MGMTVTLTMLKNASFDIFKHCSKNKMCHEYWRNINSLYKKLGLTFAITEIVKFLTHSDHTLSMLSICM